MMNTRTTDLQTTAHILMIRPAHFGYNEQTAENNTFQQNNDRYNYREIEELAMAEFDAFVNKLRAAGIEVNVVEDSNEPVKPDAVFPNNWVTFHENGSVITYPMNAPVRRNERRQGIIDQLAQRYQVNNQYHLEIYEAEELFLEGTGSMILDRTHKIVYACISPRTDEEVLDQFCLKTNYHKVLFTAVDRDGVQIYHTNVMMALGENFVVICMESIADEKEKQLLLDNFGQTGKEVIDISLDQMLSFAGNMIQLRNTSGETFLVMSEQAYQSLNPSQITQIKRHTNILYSPLTVIETYGGGSARCMIAEIFLPEK